MNIKTLKEELELTQALKLVTEAYTEIASHNLKKIRKDVEGNRIFFADLTQLYAILRFLAKKHIAGYKETGNGKTATILLTSNFRFYGRISNDATRFFILLAEKSPSDKFVVGKLGTEYLKAQGFSFSFKPLIFAKDLPSTEELSELRMKVKDYSRILVVYSEFRNVLIQLPVVKDITQTETSALAASAIKFSSAFILEPEIKKMIDFFDTAIKDILLEDTFLEAELARVASRLISMDQAQTNANHLIKSQTQSLVTTKRFLANKRIIETWITQRYRI